jgi:ABC-type nitrate/sulfonate/bicarbonate transport system substrate-binding protein
MKQRISGGERMMRTKAPAEAPDRRLRSLTRRDLLTAIGVTVVAAACAPAAPATPSKPAAAPTQPAAKPAAATQAPAKTVARPAKLTVAYPGSPGFNHVATYVAWDTLKTKGYTVETKPYANIGLATNGVVGGESQIGWIAAGGAMNAIRQGNKLKAFFHGQKNVFVMVSKKEIATFKDLNGKTVGESVPGQINDSVRVALEKKEAITTQVVRLNESTQRTQALLAGQLDAASGMQPEDYLEIESKRPGAFKILVRYSEAFPDLGGTFLWIRDDFVEQYPDATLEILENLILTYRRAYDDGNGFLAEAKKHLPDMPDDRLKASLQAYTEPKYWDPNGGMSESIGKGTGDFYMQAGTVKDAPAAADWVNWKLADTVLAKIGRR